MRLPPKPPVGIMPVSPVKPVKPGKGGGRPAPKPGKGTMGDGVGGYNRPKMGMAKGGMTKKGYAKGGMANCGASMKPAQGKGK